VRIGAVGRMVEAKDYATLMRAFSRALEMGVKAELIFLGDGPDRPLLEAQAVAMGVSGAVHFPGLQANVAEWLASFDFVAFSSIREGVPVAMLEAMAFGLPVVATRVGGIPEVITDGRDGILVECRCPEELAGAIARVARDVNLRKAIGKQGRERVASLCSREAICRRYEQLFKELLARREIGVQ